MKKAYAFMIGFLLVSVLVISALAALAKEPIVLFYGTTCPHCKNVDEWITQNNIESKLTIQHRDAWKDEHNAALLHEVASSCGLKDYGVPLLYLDGQCYVGDVDVIEALKQKAGVQ
jgi:glutaredoxin